MKQTRLLVGLMVVWAAAHGMTQDRGDQQNDSPRRATAPAQLPKKAPQARAGASPATNAFVKTFDVEMKSSSLADVLQRLETLVVKTHPELSDRFAIRMIGNDLKFEGITRNVRIKSLSLNQQRLAEILTTIVNLANPDRSASGPADRRQKLVWTIGPDPQDRTKEVVLVTTRRGAKQKGLRLPAAFLAADQRDQALTLTSQDPAKKRANDADSESWSEVISAAALEDEIKAISIALSQDITNSREFIRGGYRKSRLHFTELAILFGVVGQYDKPVRWQSKAVPIARMYARSGKNCKVGSLPVYQDAKQSRDNLADLVRGGEIRIPDGLADPIEDWGNIYDRAPLMKRMERALTKTLSKHLQDKEVSDANKEMIAHEAALIALISTVLRQKGSEDADDGDYVAHSGKLTAAAKSAAEAVRANDLDAARAAVGKIKLACSRCHEEYR